MAQMRILLAEDDHRLAASLRRSLIDARMAVDVVHDGEEALGVIALALAVAFGSSLALLVATYDAEKQADARFVTGQLGVLATLVLCAMGLSMVIGARGLRRLNPVELLREE